MTILRIVVIAIAMAVAFVWSLHAQEKTPRAEYFERITRAAVGRSVDTLRAVNCCGEGDAFAAEILGHDTAAGKIMLRVIGVMKHPTLKLGDVLLADEDRLARGYYDDTGAVRRLHVPFDHIVAFAATSGSNFVYCITFPELM